VHEAHLLLVSPHQTGYDEGGGESWRPFENAQFLPVSLGLERIQPHHALSSPSIADLFFNRARKSLHTCNCFARTFFAPPHPPVEWSPRIDDDVADAMERFAESRKSPGQT
jgi:hypothetical protein